jgi:hypothetical protein
MCTLVVALSCRSDSLEMLKPVSFPSSTSKQLLYKDSDSSLVWLEFQLARWKVKRGLRCWGWMSDVSCGSELKLKDLEIQS